MTIPSNKPLRKCALCNKEVRNLGFHIANAHPRALETLEESNLPQAQEYSQTPNNKAFSAPVGDINAMIKEKLDTMLNIKIIEMLSKGAELPDIQKALNPPASNSVSLDDIKKYHDLVYSNAAPVNLNLSESAESSASDWIGLISNALPIIQQMLSNRNKPEEIKNVTEYSGIEGGSASILKPIQAEASGNTTESGSFSEESGTLSETTTDDNGSIKTIDN